MTTLNVICINNDNGNRHLTIGKMYRAELTKNEFYRILNDNGILENFFAFRFQIAGVQSENNRLEKHGCFFIKE